MDRGAKREKNTNTLSSTHAHFRARINAVSLRRNQGRFNMKILKNPVSDRQSGIQGYQNNKRDNNTKHKKNKRDKTLIVIDDLYHLGADGHSWHIVKRIHRNGQPTEKWRPIKWYSNLEGALNGLVDFKLRISGVETLAELQEKQKRILKELSESLHAYMEVA